MAVLDLRRKLAILSDAAKYDASCASSGALKPFVVAADRTPGALTDRADLRGGLSPGEPEQRRLF
jgi:predicted DNA-binding helix-hairpin-helix protein